MLNAAGQWMPLKGHDMCARVICCCYALFVEDLLLIATCLIVTRSLTPAVNGYHTSQTLHKCDAMSTGMRTIQLSVLCSSRARDAFNCNWLNGSQ